MTQRVCVCVCVFLSCGTFLHASIPQVKLREMTEVLDEINTRKGHRQGPGEKLDLPKCLEQKDLGSRKQEIGSPGVKRRVFWGVVAPPGRQQGRW